jgi:hypothetical protein
MLDAYYKAHINRSVPGHHVVNVRNHTGKVVFPPFSGLNVNMMPIDAAFFNSFLLPEIYKGYLPMIMSCVPYFMTDDAFQNRTSRIMYVTIHEERVRVGECHRRAGIHVERPGNITDKRGHILREDWSDMNYRSIVWGGGVYGGDVPVDGIFIASNVSDTCNVWPLTIEAPECVSDKHGGLEHMRHLLGAPISLQANELCWIADRTPHESVPIPPQPNGEEFVLRQFFRLVTGKISVWYTQHNTANPLGVLPDATMCDYNKFEAVCVWTRLQSLWRGYKARCIVLEKRMCPDALFDPVFKQRRVSITGVDLAVERMKK